MMQKRGQGQFPPIDPGVPPAFGSTSVPEGAVRFNHYTRSPEAAQSIKAGGLRQSYAQESFARGGTEAPINFMTAGEPTMDFKHSHIFVEGFAHPQRGGDLDIGENWQSHDPAEHVTRLEKGRQTITARGDIPASQILAVHEPWHETARYLANEPQMERGIMAGDYDDTPHEGEMGRSLHKALDVSKTALAAKVMTGGKLGGKSYEDEGIPTERNPNPKKQ